MTSQFIQTCTDGNLVLAKVLYPKLKNKREQKQFAFVRACESGHLKVAKWLYSLKNTFPITNIRNNTFGSKFLLRSVYMNCHLNVVKWLYNVYLNIIPSLPKTLQKDIIRVNLGHMEIYNPELSKWLLTLQLEHVDHDYMFENAYIDNHLDLMQTIYSYGKIDVTSDFVINAFTDACESNKIRTAQWLRKINPDFYFEYDPHNKKIINWKALTVRDKLLQTIGTQEFEDYFESKVTEPIADTPCAICFDEDKKYWLRLDCNHMFCINCSLVAFEDKCPYCRAYLDVLKKQTLVIDSNNEQETIGRKRRRQL